MVRSTTAAAALVAVAVPAVALLAVLAFIVEDISTTTAVLVALTMFTVVKQAEEDVPTKLVVLGIAEQCYLLCRAIQALSIITKQAEGPSLLVGRRGQSVVNSLAAVVSSERLGLALGSHQSCKGSNPAENIKGQDFDSQVIDIRVSSTMARCCLG
jgi:hypothetical protein